MQVSEEEPGRNDKLQILHVGVSLGHGGMVVQHEQDAGNHQDQECSQRQCAQVPCRAEAHHALADLCREQVEEDILLDGESAVQGAVARAAAED